MISGFLTPGKRKTLESAVEKAATALEGWKEQDGPQAKWELTFRLNQAKSALHHWERNRQELKAVISHIQKWGRSRKGDRRLWLQALFDAAASGDGNGSVVFYALPQEMVDAISDRTGGRPVAVALPDLADGEVEIDEEGRVYLISPSPDGKPYQRLLFQGQVTREGKVLARAWSDNPAFDDQAAFSSDEKQIVFVTTRAGGGPRSRRSGPQPYRKRQSGPPD